MKDNIEKSFLDSAECIKKAANLSEMVEKAIKEIIDCLKKGNKIIIFGNGGSAADAQHIAAELVSKFKKDRKSFPAIALTTDTSMSLIVPSNFSAVSLIFLSPSLVRYIFIVSICIRPRPSCRVSIAF